MEVQSCFESQTIDWNWLTNKYIGKTHESLKRFRDFSGISPHFAQCPRPWKILGFFEHFPKIFDGSFSKVGRLGCQQIREIWTDFSSNMTQEMLLKVVAPKSMENLQNNWKGEPLTQKNQTWISQKVKANDELRALS